MEGAIQAAIAARSHACCKHSGYHVGSAILARDGACFTGVNIESDSYGLTVCAERVALWKALSEGAREFAGIACATADGGISCGACRQLLAEYCPPEMRCVFVDAQGNVVRDTTVGTMLPDPFRLGVGEGKK